MQFLTRNKTKALGDFIGALIFCLLGWGIYLFDLKSFNPTNPKSGFVLLLYWISENIGKLPMLLVMNGIGMILIWAGIRKMRKND